MPEITLQLVSLKPIVLDYNRVVLTLRTAGFASAPNVVLNFNAPADEPEALNFSRSESPYPNVELALLDEDGRQVSQITVIEHRQAELSLTLHLRHPQPGHLYTARAEMKHHHNTLHALNVPFILEIPPADQEA